MEAGRPRQPVGSPDMRIRVHIKRHTSVSTLKDALQLQGLGVCLAMALEDAWRLTWCQSQGCMGSSEGGSAPQASEGGGPPGHGA